MSNLGVREGLCAECPIRLWCEASQNYEPGYIQSLDGLAVEQTKQRIVYENNYADVDGITDNSVGEIEARPILEAADFADDVEQFLAIRSAGGSRKAELIRAIVFTHQYLSLISTMVNRSKHRLDLASRLLPFVADGCAKGVSSRRRHILGREAHEVCNADIPRELAREHHKIVTATLVFLGDSKAADIEGRVVNLLDYDF
jgi:hypothetical protein